MNTVIYLVFALTYVLIASRRLSLLPIGRPAGALLGAVLMEYLRFGLPSTIFVLVAGVTMISWMMTS